MQQYARAKSTGGKVRRLKINWTSLKAQNSGEAHRMEFRDQYEADPQRFSYGHHASGTWERFI
ncbi:hypothetical protein C2U43_18825 [Citrobacter freundii complex sp. CFNIH9]|nr:hypothetical protein C2U43_18825 [Citrobacter freundii complex sp. CFNIH9]